MTGTGKYSRIGWIALGGLLVSSVPAMAQDATKSIQAGGLSFRAPESWKSVPIRSTMRKAQLEVEPQKGEDFPAQLIVFVFPGGAGTVDANVARWQKQFVGEDGNPPKIESKTVKAKNTEATLVETSGRYKPSPLPGVAPEPERENARLFGAIVTSDRFGYFLKMVGPDKTMTSLRPAFEELVKSIEVEDK